MVATIRRAGARRVRRQAAEHAFLRFHANHANNGEESSFSGDDGELNYIANYTKALPRHPDPARGRLGEVDPAAYRLLLTALASGGAADFERIPLGTPGMAGRKLTNPRAGLAFDLEGRDAQSLAMRPAPRIDSAQCAAEAAELYWMAVARDVPFRDYHTDPLIATAAASLSTEFTDFRGPGVTTGGVKSVTPDTIFRGSSSGDLVGPYLSQFLLKGSHDKRFSGFVVDETDGLITCGTLKLDQRQRTVVAGSDFLTTEDDWLAVQTGLDTSGQDKCCPNRLFIRNLRDLANYVHFDALYEAYLNACLILLSEMKGHMVVAQSANTRFRFDAGNPYSHSTTQIGFGTFGAPHILSLVPEVATRALKAVWFQKWFVHRRLRPEEFGGRVHFHLAGKTAYPIHDELLASLRCGALSAHFGPSTGKPGRTFLLPQAFPEGSPTHPAYGAGHAVVAGACVTILKAWFDESFPVENPVIASADGTALELYSGADKDKLTVGGELNKLAANIAIGRNAGGVNWRSDHVESLLLGEEIAISILEEQKLCYPETFNFTLTKFDGTAISI